MREAYSHLGGTPMKRRRLSQRLSRLVDGGQLGSAVVQRGNNRRVYWTARQTYRIAHRDLAHDLIVAHMSIMLLSAGSATFLTYNRSLPPDVREASKQWTRDIPLDKNAHCADGLLWLPNDTTVIVEIELTTKSAQRLTRVLASHAQRLSATNDPATHILYITTRRVGQVIAAAWRTSGHAVDHPGRMQIIHAIDDRTLGINPNVTTIPIPD
jgi:hypothetical protein